jgi:hypothetical protein
LEIESSFDGRSNFAQVACRWGNDEEKYMIMNLLKSQIRSQGRLLRYCCIAEVRVAPPNAQEQASQYPDRTEHLQVVAQERGGTTLSSLCDIIRDASGNASLGSWRDADSLQLGNELLSGMFSEPPVFH